MTDIAQYIAGGVAFILLFGYWWAVAGFNRED